MTESNTQTSWWLAAQRASYSEFYGYARNEFDRMRVTREAAMVDASVRANIATFTARKKAGGRFSGCTTSWGMQ